jgi:hypothetical protein
MALYTHEEYMANKVSGVEKLQQEVDNLRQALQIFVDGYSAYDLVASTGMSEEWCEYAIKLSKGE